MGHARLLCIGLALTAVAVTAVGVESPVPWEGGGSPAALRRSHAEEGFVAGALVDLPTPTLRGRRGRESRVDEGSHPTGGALESSRRPATRRDAKAAQEVRIHVQCGRAYQARDEHDAARKEYEKALAVLSWYADLPDAGITADHLRALIDGARSRAVAAEDAPNLEESRAVLEVLRSYRVRSLDWEAADLDHVAAYVRAATGLDVVLSPEVRRVALDDVEISLELDDVTVQTFLDLVTEPYDLRWVPEDGRVRIRTRDELEAGLSIRYLDVKDLVDRTEESPAEAAPSAGETSWCDVVPDGDLQRAVVELVRDAIGGAAAWESPAALEIRNRILILRNDGATLDRVTALLDDVRRAGGLGPYLETYHWSTVTGAPPRSLDR